MNDLIRAAILSLLRVYKWAISPMFPPACRYTPTCSDYAAEAVDIHGALRGSAMGLWRLLRCHPFAGGGYDPVAPRISRLKTQETIDMPALTPPFRTTER